MYIEYYINAIDEKEEELKKNIELISYYPISGVLAPYNQTKFIAKNYTNIRCGCFIDYPISASNPTKRSDLILDAIDIGSKFVAICMPHYSIINRKYNKLREDIKKNLELCSKYNIEIRYILEYRKFDHQILTKVCEILKQLGVETIYPSSGLFLDNIEDNIIACAYLNSKTGIQTIVNGNIWKKNQIDNILKIKPFGMSFNQINNFNIVDLELYDK